MRVTTTDGYTLRFDWAGEGQTMVYGSPKALECFTDGLTLAGTETVSDRPTGVTPVPVGDEVALRVSAGTVAVWLTFEVLNMM